LKISSSIGSRRMCRSVPETSSGSVQILSRGVFLSGAHFSEAKDLTTKRLHSLFFFGDLSENP
jgi:hypothetical protein